MKATIYTGLALLVAAAIAYMLYAPAETAATNNYAADDEKLYQMLRADLKKYLSGKGDVYGGWLDDEVKAAYDNGAGSKTAAFVQVATLHYPAKNNYYNNILSNLQKRYK